MMLRLCKVGTVKGEVARMIRHTTPRAYCYLLHEFDILTKELALRATHGNGSNAPSTTLT